MVSLVLVVLEEVRVVVPIPFQVALDLPDLVTKVAEPDHPIAGLGNLALLEVLVYLLALVPLVFSSYDRLLFVL